MKRNLLYIFLLVTMNMGYSFPVQDPPEPQTKSHNGAGGPNPCGRTNQGQGVGVPPPVGLCLPINDYLLPLFISGILLGAYKVRKVTKS